MDKNMKHLELEPARAKAKKPDELWDDSSWIAEEKLDGWRFLMHFGGGLDRVYMTGRRTSSQTGLLSEKGLCAPCLWPYSDAAELGYTVLDGEVMPPVGAGFRDIAGIMNVSPEKAAERIAEIGNPRYFAFDILYHDGQDVREKFFIERRQHLIEALLVSQNPLVEQVICHTDKLATYDRIVDGGGEGVILKDLMSPYGEGWVKVKRYSTLDVVVTGFTQAKMGRTGKFLGQVGAALVSVYSSNGTLLEVGRVSGMTDDVRFHMTQNPGEWIGKVIEVAAQEFAKDRLRHPRFKRARPEADPRHATFQKMMADLGVAATPAKAGQQTFDF